MSAHRNPLRIFRHGRASRLALAAALVVMASATILHNRVHQTHRDNLDSLVETYASVFAARLEERVQTRLELAEILRLEWRDGANPGPEEFDMAASALLGHFDDIQAINWVDDRGIITQVVPYERNVAALGLRILDLEVPARTLRAAEQELAMRVTPPIELAQGGTGFVGYRPVTQAGAVIGYINIVFRAAPIIDQAMGDRGAGAFLVTVMDGDKPLYLPAVPAPGDSHVARAELDVAGRDWTILVAPTPLTVLANEQVLDDLILVVGLALAAATGFLVRELVRSQEQLADREERFALAMQGASDGLFDFNPSTGRAYYSPRWFEMLGYRPGEFPAGVQTFRDLLHPEDAPHVLMEPDDIDRTYDDVIEMEFRLRHKDGSWVTILSRAFIVRKAGKVERVVGTHVDITELRRQQQELERLASTDDLTGLYNRHRLHERISGLTRNLEPGERLAILHVDLDKFKAVNDTTGHEAGDHVLRETAQRLLAQTPAAAVLARVGGDEFLMAVRTRLADPEILGLATAIIDALSQPVIYLGRPCHVGASIGISILRGGEALDQATADADIGLNEAKKRGRGRAVQFEPWMRDAAVQTAQISAEIQEGLERGEFESFFQPQIDLRTDAIVGFEALLRWHHPRRGLLGAADFIAYAEMGHMVEAIDDIVFGAACDILPRLTDLGLSEASVSVNMSTAQLSRPELVGRLVERITERGLPPHRIHIEILESTLLGERSANVIGNVRRLAQAGFKLELDDFGTGHAAIASLRNFPVARIKIDKSLVTGIAADTELQAITGAIIKLGHKLDVEVLAEGIESAPDFDHLKDEGCEIGQGYHFARPMAVAELTRWIEDRTGRSSSVIQFPRASGRP